MLTLNHVGAVIQTNSAYLILFDLLFCYTSCSKLFDFSKLSRELERQTWSTEMKPYEGYMYCRVNKQPSHAHCHTQLSKQGGPKLTSDPKNDKNITFSSRQIFKI